MKVPQTYIPRAYQKDFVQALEQGVKEFVLAWARRSGKTYSVFSSILPLALSRPMNIVFVYPIKKQGRDALWDNITNNGTRIIDEIPDYLIASKDNTEMRMTLINGTTIQVLGAGEPDKLRGANGYIYIFDEMVDIDSSALDVVKSILLGNGGIRIIMSTPKIDGISGAEFKRLFDKAVKDPESYASRVKASEYMDEKALERERQETIEKYGNDFFYRQEFEVDWGSVSFDSYYGSSIELARSKSQIGKFPYDNSYKVYTAWDLGISDHTAITFFQYFDKKLRVVDYFETSDIGLDPIIRFVANKPYIYDWHFFPHDGAVRDMDAVTRLEKAIDYGQINTVLLTREGKETSLRRAIVGAGQTFFNEGTTKELIDKLLIYKRKYNKFTGEYEGPEHKTESHAADSFAYCFAALEQYFHKETGECLMNTSTSSPVLYESDTGVSSSYFLGYEPNGS